MKSTLLIVLAALAALLVAGCGGGSSDTTEAAAETQPPPAGKGPAATEEAEGDGHVAPAKQQAATKKPRSKRSRQGAEDRKNPKPQPRADGKEKETPKTVDQKVEAIIEGAGGANDDKRVVSSPKEIRKVLDELGEDPGQGGNPAEPGGVEQILEEVLGGK